MINGIHIDPPAEILADELCALLGRAELRDLVDTMALERSGLSIEDARGGAPEGRWFQSR